MSKFRYLGGIIPFTFGIVFIVGALVVACWSRPTCCGYPKLIPVGEKSNYTSFQRFVYGDSFEYVYQSSWRNVFGHKVTMYLLLIWRLVAFCYFFGIVLLWNYIIDFSDNAYYFTFWNIDLISVYYFLAIIASCIGIANDQEYLEFRANPKPTARITPIGEEAEEGQLNTETNNQFWTTSLMKYGYAIQILYEITTSTAFFVTALVFASLDSELVFWNINDHLVTTASLLIELGLNRMAVRWEHLIFTVIWALMYLIFIWPLVARGNLFDWPYFFLETDTVIVFIWYVGLVIFLALFYWVLLIVSCLKYRLLGAIERKCIEAPTQPPNTPAVPEKDINGINSDIELNSHFP